MTVYQIEYVPPGTVPLIGEHSNHGLYEAQPDAQAARDAIATLWVESGWYTYDELETRLILVAYDVTPASEEP